jgi:hypothetical protein
MHPGVPEATIHSNINIEPLYKRCSFAQIVLVYLKTLLVTLRNFFLGHFGLMNERGAGVMIALSITRCRS